MIESLRGEVWIVDLGLTAKVRPCLVMSIPYKIEERALVTVLPHTTAIRNTRFEVRITANYLKSGVFDIQNVITIPRAKLIRKLGNLSFDDITSIENTLKLWLGL